MSNRRDEGLVSEGVTFHPEPNSAAPCLRFTPNVPLGAATEPRLE